MAIVKLYDHSRGDYVGGDDEKEISSPLGGDTQIEQEDPDDEEDEEKAREKNEESPSAHGDSSTAEDNIVARNLEQVEVQPTPILEGSS